MSEDIRELPNHTDFVHIGRVPRHFQVKKLEDRVVLLYQGAEGIFHCDCVEPVDGPTTKIMVDNLASIVFEARHPGELSKMPRRKALAAMRGEELSPEDCALFDEYKQLQAH